MMESNRFYDSAGNELKPGDIVRMYHFTGTRNRKHYMYKRFRGYEEKNGKTFGIWEHLEKPGHFFHDCDNQFKNVSVVVERAKYEKDNLKRNPKLRD